MRSNHGMKMPVTTDDISFAARLATASAEAIRPHFRAPLTVDDKGFLATHQPGFDPVTIADKGAEQAMRALIAAERPEDGIIGEEFGTEAGKSGKDWVLDPIDGTRSFITGMMSGWGTLIALAEGGVPQYGILNQPITGERFSGTAEKAELSWNGETRVLHSRRCGALEDAVLMTTHPWECFTEEENPIFRNIADRARMTRFSADCYGYAMVALGHVDLVIESGLKPWDIAALIPIIEGAGGVVTDWQGNPHPMGGQVIAAGDPALHEKMLPLLAA